MIVSSLYPKIEWYFEHYRQLKDAPPTVMVMEMDGHEVSCPAAWVTIIDATYKLHENLISRAMEMRYKDHKPVEVITGLLCINARMFYRWREEFLTDAILLAMQKHLMHIPKTEK